MYYYNGTCYSQCPTSTYALPNNDCQACDTVTAQCLDCSGSPTACTSCQPGLYLSQPSTGTCISTCSGSYPLYDEANMVCVNTCPSNTIANANGSCLLCSGSDYLESGSCVATCSPGTYPDGTLKACMNCHSDC